MESFFSFYHPLWAWWIFTALRPRAKLPLCHRTPWTITQLLREREREEEECEKDRTENKREEIKEATEETSHRDRLHSLCTAAQQRVWFIPEFARGELGFTISKWALIHLDSRELTSSSFLVFDSQPKAKCQCCSGSAFSQRRSSHL